MAASRSLMVFSSRGRALKDSFKARRAKPLECQAFSLHFSIFFSLFSKNFMRLKL
jgi:hypothetical protein